MMLQLLSGAIHGDDVQVSSEITCHINARKSCSSVQVVLEGMAPDADAPKP